MAKKENNELVNRNQAFLIYQDDNGIARVNVRFEGEDVWLTQEQMMDLFDASQQDVSYHIGQIYKEGEQDPGRTLINFLIVRQGYSADWRCYSTRTTTTGLSGN